MKHMMLDTDKLMELVEETSRLFASGNVPKQWPEMDAKIAKRISENPRNLAMLTVYLSSIRNALTQTELEFIAEGKLSQMRHGFGIMPIFLDFIQVGYNLALRELGMDDTKGVSNGTRPLQA